MDANASFAKNEKLGMRNEGGGAQIKKRRKI